MGYVSYELSEIYIKVFMRFVCLLIENGYVEELFCCFGIFGFVDWDFELFIWVLVRDIIYILYIVFCWVEVDYNLIELG